MDLTALLPPVLLETKLGGEIVDIYHAVDGTNYGIDKDDYQLSKILSEANDKRNPYQGDVAGHFHYTKYSSETKDFSDQEYLRMLNEFEGMTASEEYVRRYLATVGTYRALWDRAYQEKRSELLVEHYTEKEANRVASEYVERLMQYDMKLIASKFPPAVIRKARSSLWDKPTINLGRDDEEASDSGSESDGDDQDRPDGGQDRPDDVPSEESEGGSDSEDDDPDDNQGGGGEANFEPPVQGLDNDPPPGGDTRASGAFGSQFQTPPREGSGASSGIQFKSPPPSWNVKDSSGYKPPAQTQSDLVAVRLENLKKDDIRERLLEKVDEEFQKIVHQLQSQQEVPLHPMFYKVSSSNYDKDAVDHNVEAIIEEPHNFTIEGIAELMVEDIIKFVEDEIRK